MKSKVEEEAKCAAALEAAVNHQLKHEALLSLHATTMAQLQDMLEREEENERMHQVFF